MTYIIAEPCVGTCDTACVDVCPVDCIHGPFDKEGAGAEVHKEGFDPEKISDQLYFASMEDTKYINLDKDLFSKINNQEVRV